MIFSDNMVGDEGAKVIAEMLKENHSLKDLHLFDDQIGDKGALALEKALKTNKTLQFMDLSQNKITEPAKKRLRDIASKNPKLTLVL